MEDRESYTGGTLLGRSWARYRPLRWDCEPVHTIALKPNCVHPRYCLTYVNITAHFKNYRRLISTRARLLSWVWVWEKVIGMLDCVRVRVSDNVRQCIVSTNTFRPRHVMDVCKCRQSRSSVNWFPLRPARWKGSSRATRWHPEQEWRCQNRSRSKTSMDNNLWNINLSSNF